LTAGGDSIRQIFIFKCNKEPFPCILQLAEQLKESSGKMRSDVARPLNVFYT